MSDERWDAENRMTRRELLAASGSVAALGMRAPAEAQASSSEKPNLLIIIADQVRWDVIGAYGLNPTNVTPNLDAMAQRGTLYRRMFTNQPVCSPSRACLFTGEYPARHGVWRNTGSGVGLAPNAQTIATACRKAGYSANYIGKWHLHDGPPGPVPAENRGGFFDLWQAANALELTSHPFEGDMWDGDGRPMHFENEYRVDYLTGLAKHFLQNVSKSSPFLLVVSYLEPHHQNDLHHVVAPQGYADRYRNPFVPEDLKHFPGNWQEELPDYYGSIKRIDESVGEIRQSLAEHGLGGNTIVAFLSDHGCHFMTRNTEYKRSGHDASIHIPLVIEGPGFEGGHQIHDFACMVDFSPTLLEAAGVPVPDSMQGRSTLPLVSGKAQNWRNEVFVQMSEYWVGRALRTPEWTYVMVAPRGSGTFKPAPNAPLYSSFQLYNNFADPHQLVNLAGRKETVDIEAHLRERLKTRMQEAGDHQAELGPCQFPYA